MKFRVEETTYKQIADVCEALSVRAYPYQKTLLLRQADASLKYRVKERSPLRCFAVYDGSRAILVAPMRIHGDTAKLVGTAEGFNMSDFLYDTTDAALLAEAIVRLMEYLKEKVFSRRAFRLALWYLYEGSLTWQAVRQLQSEGRLSFTAPVETLNNVEIPLRGDYESYYNSLSKHARQNIRTAYNRVNRDGHRLDVHFYHMDALNAQEKKQAHDAFRQYMDLYLKRLKDRYKWRKRTLYLHAFTYKILGGGWESASSAFSVLADVAIDGKIVAFAKIYTDYIHQKVTVPMLAIDLAAGFFSPGIILVNEMVKHFLEQGGVETISLGRGEESYKYEMGGVVYETYKLSLALPQSG